MQYKDVQWHPSYDEPQQTPGKEICHYHRNFGWKARSCREPCIFSGNQMVKDNISLKWFLIDTVASVSVLPHQTEQTSAVTVTKLIVANGSIVKTYGTKSVETDFGLTNQIIVPFHVVDVGQSILGDDFLKINKLLVDIEGQCLIKKQQVTKFSVKTNQINQ